MGSNFLQLIIFGLVAAAANVLGGLILFPSRLHDDYRRFLKYLLALGAGFMLAVTFFEIVPRTILIWQQSYADSAENLSIPMLLLLVGYLLTQFLEHTIAPHFHLGEEIHSHEEQHSQDGIVSRTTAYSAIGGLLVHTFFDGVSIAAATQIDVKVGFLVFIAIFLHKFPEGFTVGSLLVGAGRGVREVVLATSLIGGMTLLGVLLFYFVGTNLSSSVAYALPLASGVTLYVAASDLIPEVNHHGGHRPGVSISVFAGVALFFGLHYALHEFLGH